MATPAARARPLTVEEYLTLEESASVKHEYVAGRVHALSGVSARHNRIALNIATRLLAAAAGGPCKVYMNDVKLRAADDAIYYPDVMVICEPHAEESLVVESPCLLVEVISPSTTSIDRREKLMTYRGIATLRTYLIVEQEERRVERWFREADGTWWHADVARQGHVPVPCPPTVLTLDEIYEGIESLAP